MSFIGVVFVIIVFGGMLVGLFFLMRYAICQMTKYNDKAKELNAEKHGTLKHISGLPIAENTEVEMFICPNEFVFFGANQEISVTYDKIISVDKVIGRGDPSKQMSDAAVGGLLLGAAGAALMAVSVGTTCLVVTYRNGETGENKFIILDGSKSTGFVKKAVKQFQQNSLNVTAPTKVQL